MDEAHSPPRKVANKGYRYCSHCNRMVSHRTYLKHATLPSPLEASLSDVPLRTVVDAPDVDGAVLPDPGEYPEEYDPSHEENGSELDSQYSGTIEEDGSDLDSPYYSGSSSSSEYDSESDSETDHDEMDISETQSEGTNNAQSVSANALVRWLVIFLRIWQSMFKVSEAAFELLLKFVSAFLNLLATLASSVLLKEVSSKVPQTLHLLRKYLGSDKQSFINYVTCPSCFSIYKYDDCIDTDQSGDLTSKRCKFIKFPNHPQKNRRLPCNAPLLTKVHMSGGKVKFVPRFIYSYQPIKVSLQKLLNRSGFVENLEHWRTRKTVEGYMSDIYDGKVWNDFNSPKYSNFLKSKRCYGLMLNFDFFQPYKHVADSYGVFYATLINLPRSQRFKQENVLLLGIVPAFEHEPNTLNHFMEPLISELKEFWSPGVKLYTAESPNYKILFKVALMCIACDIPAARKISGFMGHNATLACSRCLKSFPGGFNVPKDYSGFDRKKWPLRDLMQHRETCTKLKKCKTQNAKNAMESSTGTKYSVLINLPYFDPIRFTIVDPMHNLFLGTAKHMMKVWMEKELITKDDLKLLQSRVDSIIVPCDVGRIPRKIASSFGGFTAEQWKNWVILFSMFALRGILPQQHYVCWQTFVLSCYYLCQREISMMDVKKADLLIVKFCERAQSLYGDSVVTMNMHLHGHIASCVEDYGSIYNFWLFAFERYNGVLGDYPTNKRNTSTQLMQRFIYDVESLNFSLPDLYRETLHPLLPTNRRISEVHHHHTLQNCSENHDLFLECIDLPTISKSTVLNPNDLEKLQHVYSYLYSDTAVDDQMIRTIKVYKTITVYKHHLGSLKSPSTSHSSYVMASWADKNGSIQSTSTTKPRPGKVLFYFSHQCRVNGRDTTHLFATVYWYADHHCYSLFGKPLEIWSSNFIQEGPAMFLPMHKLLCRCAVAHATVPLPDGDEETALFVSPLPNLSYH